MKTLLIICQLIVLTLLTVPSAGAAAEENAEWAKRCQTDYAALDFGNAGQCVSHYARGGGVVTGPATLTLTFDATPCATNPEQLCIWSVQGSGLDPASQVIVGEAAVLYGATVTVDSAGRVSANGIYQLGSCVTSGYEHQLFIARGVAADGSAVASPEVAGDVSLYLPICGP